MRPTALLLVVAGGLASGAVADSKPSGKIIRIERASYRRTVPLLCGRIGSENSCFGKDKPVVGEVVSFVDDTQRVGEARIGSVTPSAENCNYSWNVTYDGPTPPTDRTSGRGEPSGIIGGAISPRGHRIANPDETEIKGGAPGERIILAIDRSGDDRMDLAISFFMCDKNGQANPNNYDDYCFSFWDVDGDKYTKTAVMTNLRECFNRR